MTTEAVEVRPPAAGVKGDWYGRNVGLGFGLIAGPRPDASGTMVVLTGVAPLLVMLLQHSASRNAGTNKGRLVAVAATLIAWGGAYAAAALFGATDNVKVGAATAVVAIYTLVGAVSGRLARHSARWAPHREVRQPEPVELVGGR